ncbi:hypothetical protein GQ42DRAFT_43576 [Ramicandelaber brevisporus]|nr:hypothetical protein GQ42DRAFT_43576 [Ramicandelaber brevisporus]
MTSRQPVILNEYALRKSVKDGACYVCSKPTTSLLTSPPPTSASASKSASSTASSTYTADWFYVCPSHCSDPSFGSIKIPAPDQVSSMPAYSPQQASSPSPKDDVKSSKEGQDAKADDKKKDDDTQKQSATPAPSEPPKPAGPTIVTLHRDIFYLRERIHVKQWQAAARLQMLNRAPSIPDKPLPGAK